MTKRNSKLEESAGKPAASLSAGLSAQAQAFYDVVQADYVLEEHHQRLLLHACECLDRVREARAAVAEAGAYYVNKNGEVRPHPALQVEHQAKALFMRHLREMNLDITPPEDASRPPRIQGRYR